jgi:antitoxin (DNA-binding transcriptional repressor) of toxin-antitoxin stability system
MRLKSSASGGIRSLLKVATGSYLPQMRTVGIKILKNKLSEYVKLAASGETILVTDRDVVVAELVPPRDARNAWTTDPRLTELVRRGVIVPPTDARAPLPSREPVASLEAVMRNLDDSRGDR